MPGGSATLEPHPPLLLCLHGRRPTDKCQPFAAVAEVSRVRGLGFTGMVKSNPTYEICRSQQDVEIQGDWKKLVNEVRDSHWMMAYGDHLKELAYATRKLGIQWTNLPEA